MQNMRDMLRGSLGRSLSAMSDEDRLAAAWPVACGRAMAERGQIAGIVEGIVQVEVADEPWLRQMLAVRGVLERDLARISGVRLSGIHFYRKQRSAR